MAFIPISQMIRPLSDFYDPVKAEQVRLTQMKIAAEQQNQAMQQRLADAYKMSEIPAMSPQVAGLMNMTGAIGGVAGAPMAPAMPNVTALINKELSADLQRSTMDRAKQEYMRMGRLDEALAIEEAQAKQQKLARGGGSFAPFVARVGDKNVMVRPREDGYFISTPEGEKQIFDFVPMTAGQSGATIPEVARTVAELEAEGVAKTSKARTIATGEAERKYKEEQANREVDVYRRKQDIDLQTEAQKAGKELPAAIRKELTTAAESFRSDPSFKTFQSTTARASAANAMIDEIKALRERKVSSAPAEMYLLYNFVRTADDNKVTDREFITAGAGVGWKSWAEERLKQLIENRGAVAPLDDNTLEGMRRATQITVGESAKAYNVARRQYLDRYEGEPGFELQKLIKFFPAPDNIMRQMGDAYRPEVIERIRKGMTFDEAMAEVGDASMADETLPPDTQLGAEPNMPQTTDEATEMLNAAEGPSLELEPGPGVSVQRLYPQAAPGVLAPGLDANYVMPPDSTNPVTGVDMYGNKVTVPAPRGIRLENEMPASGTVPVPASGTTKIGSNLELLRMIRGGNR